MTPKKLKSIPERYLQGIHLYTNTPAQPGDLEELEQRICSSVFDSSTPLGRCLQAEADFNLFPFPVREALHIAISGDQLSPTMLTICACHPDSRLRKNGVVEAVIDVHTFDQWLQEAFLAYLANFLGARRINRRIANDRRYTRLVDPKTGELFATGTAEAASAHCLLFEKK